MTRTVRDIMNAELFSIRASARTVETLEAILEFGITAVPVLDDDGRPIGVSSLRDLVRQGPEKAPVTVPATTVSANASVAAAAETMATTNRHHLVVVGSDGKAIGMVSTLDVIRALLELPSKHPATFPRHDAELEASWSNDQALPSSSDQLDVPTDPGVLLFMRGGAGTFERPVWVEATTSLRARVREMIEDRSGPISELRDIGALGFRYSIVRDASGRERLVQRLRARIANAPPPGGT